MKVKGQHLRALPSRFSACFRSPLGSIAGDAVVPVEVPGAGSGSTVSWFTWSRLRKKTKKKNSLLEPFGEVTSITPASIEVSGEETKSQKLAKGRSIQVPLAEKIPVDNEIRHVRVPKISPKFSGNVHRSLITVPSESNTNTRTCASPEPTHNTTRRRAKLGKRQHQGKLGTRVGLSVVAVTLVVMLVWGRACAVICLCCSFYLLPVLRTAENNYTAISVDFDDGVNMESEKYKQQVVLEGLLQREGRRVCAATAN